MTKMNHPCSEKIWTIWTVQIPIHTKYQTMLRDESVVLKYNISIIKPDWLVVVCISCMSNSQLMVTDYLPPEGR